MTYKETLDWMFHQLPMYQLKGRSAFNGKLDNSLMLARHLGHPEKKFKSIHVAGTNGKGSSSHMLASILQEAGYNVGLYTSPHLKDFRERIRINGKPVAKKFVVDFIDENQLFLTAHHMSFFEMSVGMAFDYFATRKVDIAIIEVGLGGRLDSTNIIDPEVALITNIGYDHTDILGNTLREIALEKGGIIKRNKPVVISETQKEIKPIFQKIAREKQAKIIYADTTIKEEYKTTLLGHYQAKNIKGVMAVLHELKGYKVNKGHVVSGLKKVVENTGLMGRWQVLGTHPKIVCDTAHNTEGLRLVLEQINEQKFNALHIVLGFVREKNLEPIFPLLPKQAQYYFCMPNIQRGLEVKNLHQRATKAGLIGESFPSVKKALAAAIHNAAKTDFIFVGGSTFVVAEVV